MFGIFSSHHKYGHVISLGYNCEVSFQFFLQYHFVESSLFAWTMTQNCENLVYALNHIDEVGSQGFEPGVPMYKDIATNIFFHTKSYKPDAVPPESEIIAELKSRVDYLRNKFIKTAADGKKNLYIFKYPPVSVPSENVRRNILNLYSALNNICKNAFDLLIILDEKTSPDLAFDYENLFVRRVKFFTPTDRVTSKPYDRWHFRRIFREFRPAFKLPKNKKFKFEERN